MVTSNRWNYSAMLARGGDRLTNQEIEVRTEQIQERWKLIGQKDAEAGINPEHVNIRHYLDAWLQETHYITGPEVYQAGHGYRFHCVVSHIYNSDFQPFKVDAVVAVASLKALTTLVRSVFGRDFCVIDWEAASEPF